MDALKDFVAGTISGAAAITAGQPLDTVKVRLQTQGQLYTGTMDCLIKTIKTEGILAPYKGLLPPLSGLAFQNAILFASYGSTCRFLHDGDGIPPLSVVFMAGTFAGFSQSFVASPIELVKVKLQDVAQSSSIQQSNHKMLATMKQIFRDKGLIGFYRGYHFTLLRDFYSYGVYFAVYEWCKRSLSENRKLFFFRDKQQQQQQQQQQLQSCSPVLDIFVAGGVAGMVSWASIYPMDVLKSRYQLQVGTEIGQSKTWFSGLGSFARTTIKTHGISVLFQGFNSTMWRAFIVNGVTFITYELILAIW